jgi:hypothetical protein
MGQALHHRRVHRPGELVAFTHDFTLELREGVDVPAVTIQTFYQVEVSREGNAPVRRPGEPPPRRPQ